MPKTGIEIANRMKQRFERIYAHNDWGNGSGEGSLPIYAQPYAGFLQRFLRQHDIRSVVDFGCGDWQFSKTINWTGIEYKGYDIVTPVIDENRARYQTEHITFHEVSRGLEDLPGADLLLAKDVLQHWSDESVLAFLPVVSRYRYTLITNCVNPFGPTLNLPIEDAGFRYLDIRSALQRRRTQSILVHEPPRTLRQTLWEAALAENGTAHRTFRPIAADRCVLCRHDLRDTSIIPC